jgi:hypothetical protein
MVIQRRARTGERQTLLSPGGGPSGYLIADMDRGDRGQFRWSSAGGSPLTLSYSVPRADPLTNVGFHD